MAKHPEIVGRYIELEPLQCEKDIVGQDASSGSGSNELRELPLQESFSEKPCPHVFDEASTPDSSSVKSADSTASLEFDIAVLEREEAFLYGWGRFRPACLQWCRSPYFILAVFCFCVVAQMFGIHGIYPNSMRFLHLRFRLSPDDLALIRMMFDVGGLIIVFPVIYCGVHDANRPMWIGCGAFIVGIATLLFALPQFLIGPYQWHVEGHDLCSEEVSECESENVAVYKSIFVVAMLLYGMGVTPTLTMGLTYLDENVSHQTSIVFTGVFMVCTVLGTALGYLASAQLIQIQGDIFKAPGPRTPMKTSDEEWYGAWWIGMLITTLLSWLTAIPLSGFPRRLPDAMRAQMDDMKMWVNRRKNESISEASTWYPKAVVAENANVFRRCLGVLCIPPFFGLVVDFCAHYYFLTSFAMFMPVYITRMFHISTETTAVVSSAIVLVALLSLVAGMCIQHFFYLGVVGNVRFALFASLGTLVFFGVFYVRCPLTDLAGVTKPYPIYRGDDFKIPGPLGASCNNMCNCSHDHFHPVWYDPKDEKEGMVMFSECYAGCHDKNDTHFFDCDCVPVHPKETDANVTDAVFEGGGAVEREYRLLPCPSGRLYAFLIGLGWLTASLFSRINAVNQGMLRCVPFHQRVVGIGIAAAFARMFGSIPSSPLIGYFQSQSCFTWKTRCGVAGDCAWYDIKLANMVMYTCFALSALSVIGLILAACTVKRYEHPTLHIKMRRERDAAASVKDETISDDYASMTVMV